MGSPRVGSNPTGVDLVKLHAATYMWFSIINWEKIKWNAGMTSINWAVGVVVSHPLSMREAQGSIPWLSILPTKRWSSSPISSADGQTDNCTKSFVNIYCLQSQHMTPAGLESAIPGSVGRCLIHWATGPSSSLWKTTDAQNFFCPSLHLPLGVILEGQSDKLVNQHDFKPRWLSWESVWLKIWRSPAQSRVSACL